MSDSGLDLSSLSSEDLNNILIANGFEDAIGMGQRDKLALVRTLFGFPEDDNVNTQASTTSDEDNRTAHQLVEPAPVGVQVAEMTSDTPAVPAPAPTSDPETMQSTPEGQMDVEVDNPADREAKVTSFCDISGSDRDFARSVLSDLGWDLDSAIMIFLEGGISVPEAVPQPRLAPSSGGSGNPSSNNSNSVFNHFRETSFGNENPPSTPPPTEATSDTTRPPEISGVPRPFGADFMHEMLSTFRQHESMNLGEGQINDFARLMERTMRGDSDEGEDEVEDDHSAHGIRAAFARHLAEIQRQNAAAEAESESQSGDAANAFYDDGVRVRTDPIRLQRLMSRGRSGDDDDYDVFRRADDPNVEWIVEPARHLSFLGSFEQAKTMAKNENRWLLVNIQSHDAFASNELNRDTWRDETVESILRGPFLFWQRGHTSQDGVDFVRMYRVNVEELPIIAVIEPNTGAKFAMYKGYVDPQDMADRLIGFLDKHGPHSPKASGGSAASGSVTGMSTGDTSSRGDSPVVPASSSVKADQDTPRPAEAVSAPPPASSAPAAAFDGKIYGTVPPEPAEGDSAGFKLSIKLPAKRLVRRFHDNDTVRALFAYIVQQDPESSTRPFELTFRGPPPVSLSSQLDAPLSSCNLRNAQIFHTWL